MSNNTQQPEVKNFLTEQHLVECGFKKNLMPGTGWNSINSMRDAVYYYTQGRITINATYYWTWFLDGEQRNDICVCNKEELEKLLKKYNSTQANELSSSENPND